MPSTTRLERLSAWWRALRDAASTRRQAQAQAADLGALRLALENVERALQTSNSESGAKLGIVETAVNRLTAVQEQLAVTQAKSIASQAQISASQAQMAESQTQLDSSQARLGASHEALRAAYARVAAEVLRLSPPFPALAKAGDQDSVAWLDAAFEGTFRGTRLQVRERLAAYVPDARNAHATTGQLAVVDVGCGRGEWLELMRGEGIAAHGIDNNAFIVKQCHELGLDARHGDAIKALEATSAQTLAAVTAFHLIEHLPLARQLQLLVATHRALAPGGVLILETPNPENLVVGAWTFYMDPTHQRPLPPTLLRFLLEAVGFEVGEMRRLNPDDGLARRADQEGWPAGVRELLCGPRDFGVIARRPRD